MIIYKITNNVNGKVYIGQTSRSLEERMSEHCRHNEIIVDKAIQKYGIDSFTVEIVDSAETIDEANQKEIEWIAKCDCITPKGYNQETGGGTSVGFHHREESKQKMSATRSGMYQGENNPFYGKTHSEETRKRWSEQRKGRTLSEEWRHNIGEGLKKKVINIDTGEVFNSVKEAAAYYGLKDTHITRVCKGGRKTTGGYHWKYYDA